MFVLLFCYYYKFVYKYNSVFFIFLRPTSVIINVLLSCVIKMQETNLINYFLSTFPDTIEVCVKFGGDYVDTMVRLILCQRFAQYILRPMILFLIWKEGMASFISKLYWKTIILYRLFIYNHMSIQSLQGNEKNMVMMFEVSKLNDL